MQVKNIVTTTAAIAASLVLIHAEAATKGAYIGAGLGGSQLDAANNNKIVDVINSIPGTITHSSTQRYGIAGKLFGGYNFNEYIGVEANYQMYSRSLNKINESYNGMYITSTNKIKRGLSALDLVGKAYLPLQQFDLYALAGVAETFNTLKTKYTVSDDFYDDSLSETFTSLRPIIGVGANYNINSHVTTGIEFSHIQGKGNLNRDVKAVPNANLLTLTAAYNFG